MLSNIIQPIELPDRMPCIAPATEAVVYYPVLVDSDPAVGSGHEIRIAVPAKSFPEFRRKPYLVFHCYPSCQLNMLV